MKVFAYMEHGANKICSEDTMVLNGQICKDGYFSFDASGKCVAVADGVGGHNSGEIASRMAAAVIAEYVSDKGVDLWIL